MRRFWGEAKYFACGDQFFSGARYPVASIVGFLENGKTILPDHHRIGMQNGRSGCDTGDEMDINCAAVQVSVHKVYYLG